MRPLLLLACLAACTPGPTRLDGSRVDTDTSPTDTGDSGDTGDTGDTGNSGPAKVDADGDGYDEATDCNDQDKSISPGATDGACDGIDRNCDGQDHTEVAVLWTPNVGSAVDHTADVVASVITAPLQLVLDRPGELRVCGKDVPLQLEITGTDVFVRGDPVGATSIRGVLLHQLIHIGPEASGTVEEINVFCKNCTAAAHIEGTGRLVGGEMRSAGYEKAITYSHGAQVDLEQIHFYRHDRWLSPADDTLPDDEVYATGTITGGGTGPLSILPHDETLQLRGQWTLEDVDIRGGTTVITAGPSLTVINSSIRSGDAQQAIVMEYHKSTRPTLQVTGSSIWGHQAITLPYRSTVSIEDSVLQPYTILATPSTYAHALKGTATILDVENSTFYGYADGAVFLKDPTFAHFTDTTFRGVATTGGYELSLARGPLTIEGITVDEGFGFDTGVVRCTRCTFEDQGSATNSGYAQGAVHVYDGIFEATDSVWTRNRSSGAGGAIHATNAFVSLYDPTFTQNVASGHAGAIYADDTDLWIEGALFDRNQATLRGVGALKTVGSSGKLVLIDSTFTGNTGAYDPGAAHLTSGADLYLEGLTWRGNVGEGVGALHLDISQTDSLSLSGTHVFEDNTATGSAGALLLSSKVDLTLPGHRFHRNQASTSCGSALRVDTLAEGVSISLPSAQWGSGATDNIPGDLRYSAESCIPDRFPGVASIVCTSAGCDAP